MNETGEATGEDIARAIAYLGGSRLDKKVRQIKSEYQSMGYLPTAEAESRFKSIAEKELKWDNLLSGDALEKLPGTKRYIKAHATETELKTRAEKETFVMDKFDKTDTGEMKAFLTTINPNKWGSHYYDVHKSILDPLLSRWSRQLNDSAKPHLDPLRRTFIEWRRAKKATQEHLPAVTQEHQAAIPETKQE